MLTDTQCRIAKPKEKLYRLNDFNGLYLEIKPNDKKAWRYRFKLNGHDPYIWLRDVLTRLPTRPNSRISELLPYAENRFR